MLIPSKWLILDAYSPRTLGLVRSLGQRGIEFVLAGTDRHDMCLRSRYCREWFIYTSPHHSISGFVADLNEKANKYDFDLIVPTAEATILACRQKRSEFNKPVLISTDEVIDTVYNKRRILEMARESGINVPETVYVDSSNYEAKHLAVDRFPVAIKAESSDRICGDRILNTGDSVYALDHETLLSSCRNRMEKSPLLVQEFIDGYGIGISGVFIEGEALVLFGHRRLRESTPTGGPAAYMESIRIPENLCQEAAQLMKRTGYSGPAMVEYKVDYESGKAYLMEINCRLWGSIMFPLSIGVDIPYIWWKSVNGMEVTEDETRYEPGRRGRYLLGDTKCLLQTLKGKPKEYPGAFPGRIEALASYLYSFVDPRTKNLLLGAGDMGPFWARLRKQLKIKN